MQNRFAAIAVVFIASLVFCGFMVAKPTAGNTPVSAAIAPSIGIVAATAECSDCENRCQAWVDKCKDGGQYACYKAAACLCKCNLDEGGCGSSKDALRECYEQNEKLARELGPPDER
jgi:hypothetical protein